MPIGIDVKYDASLLAHNNTFYGDDKYDAGAAAAELSDYDTEEVSLHQFFAIKVCCRMTIGVRVMTFPKLYCARVYASETSMRGWLSEVFLFCRLRGSCCFIMSVVL